MVHYITTINGLLEMERTSFAREYEEFMADILHSEGLHTVGESSDKLSVLLKELNDNGFSFEFGLGKRSIVFDIVHKERCSNPDTKCLCEDKTYHVSIILAYDGFEILVSLVGGEPGYDVRNGDVTYHNTQEKVVDEVLFFKNHGVHGYIRERIGNLYVFGTKHELEQWNELLSRGKVYIPKWRILKHFE
jgi:hypothetical protein